MLKLRVWVEPLSESLFQKFLESSPGIPWYHSWGWPLSVKLVLMAYGKVGFQGAVQCQ